MDSHDQVPETQKLAVVTVSNSPVPISIKNKTSSVVEQPGSGRLRLKGTIVAKVSFAVITVDLERGEQMM